MAKSKYARALRMEEVKDIPDEDINFDDIPEWTDDDFKKAWVRHPDGSVTPPEILNDGWYKYIKKANPVIRPRKQ